MTITLASRFRPIAEHARASSGTGSPGPDSKRRPLFASLHVYNYRVYFVGSLTSNIGTWMARIAQDWLVLMILTNQSAAALGLVTGLQFLPIALLTPYGGAVADRFSKRTLLMATQAAMALTGALLALLVLTDTVTLWHVYALATLTGIASAFDMPARQAFVSEMVPRHLLSNAVGLNSASFNSARLVGPGIAGLLIGVWGVGPAMLFNALSFVAVIGALAAMRPAELHPSERAERRGAVRAGLRYVSGRPDIVVLLVIVFVLGTFGLNFQISNALMATAVFGLGAEEFGLLGSVMAVGSLAGALLAAKRTRPRLRLVLGALTAFAVSTAALGLAPTYPVYTVLLVPVGLSALTVMTAANATVQLTTDPSMRGRVMALYMTIFMGGTPLGAPFVGWLGDVAGPRWTVLIGSVTTGLTALAVASWILHRRHREADTQAVESAATERAGQPRNLSPAVAGAGSTR
ncbi:MAG: MFS transporter [Dermatophilus congolensis]|nr:MFS transporter [Dermatophilus congolensis]